MMQLGKYYEFAARVTIDATHGFRKPQVDSTIVYEYLKPYRKVTVLVMVASHLILALLELFLYCFDLQCV